MKKYLLIAGLLFIGLRANSQILISLLLGDKLNTGKIEFGLNGGLNLATMHGLPDAKILPCFNLGFYFDFKLNHPSWMFNTGVIVKSTLGAQGLPVYSLNDPTLDTAFSGGSIARKLRYFNVPLMMKYTFKEHFYVKGGIQLGLRFKANDNFINEVKEKDDLKYKIEIKDEFHPLDAGLAAGVGYRLLSGNGMNIEMQYYMGLIDVLIEDSSPQQFNRSLYFTVGIPIGKGKKPKS